MARKDAETEGAASHGGSGHFPELAAGHSSQRNDFLLFHRSNVSLNGTIARILPPVNWAFPQNTGQNDLN